MRNRDQNRAMNAYGKVEAVSKQHDQPFGKKYGSICLKFPAMIQYNGLCQAVAFHQAKAAKQEYSRLFLSDLAKVVYADDTKDLEALAGAARSLDSAPYQWLTRETMHCAVWFKRYAEAVLRVEPGEEE